MTTNNQQKSAALAKKIGLSESAVLRRLRRLRNEKVIAADVSIVRPSAIGLGVVVHVLVSLEREGAAELRQFVDTLRARPEVKAAWYVTGECDFVVLLHFEKMTAYEAFTRDVFHSNANVRGFRTLVSIREAVPRRGV